MPRPAKNSMFLNFFEKNNVFYVDFEAESRFLPPPPLEKSADAHDVKLKRKIEWGVMIKIVLVYSRVSKLYLIR